MVGNIWLILFFNGLLALEVTKGQQFTYSGDICYSPGIHRQLLHRDVSLRDKLYMMRREYTADTLATFHTEIIPKKNVPPLDVLKKVFLKYDYVIEPACLYQVTEEKFNAWQKQMQDDYDTRQDLLAGVDATPSSPPFVKKLEPIDDFCASLIPDGKFQGIRPLGGVLENSRICDHTEPPYGRLRKTLKYKVKYSEKMVDTASVEFKEIKLDVEKKFDDILSGLEFMREKGYAGTTVLAVGKVIMGKVPERAPGDPPPVNATDRIDTVVVETEILFGGRKNIQTPKEDLDAIMAARINELEWVEELGVSRTGNCLASEATSPGGTYTKIADARSILYNGQNVSFQCEDPAKTFPPEADDSDSNFKIESVCLDGKMNYRDRDTPGPCADEDICNSVPTPSPETGLKRADSRIKFRKGERAWFTCENEDALIEDKASEFFKLNFVYIECPGTNGRKFNESLYDNTTNVWPKCELQKTCPLDSLPAPDSASGLQLQQRKGNILVGEHAIYECMRRSEFFEMNINGTDKAEEKYLCKETGVEAPNPWPECKKLPCVCLGDRGLSVEHANLILNGEASKEPSCGSTTNYLKFKDTQGSPYIIPKQTNCGTYKVHSPDLENACECPSAGKPVNFWNEITIIGPDTWTWNDNLADVTSYQFQFRKTPVERYVNTFLLSKKSVKASGFMRSVVVFFEGGPEHPTVAGSKTIKAMLQHQFRADTNFTFNDVQNYFKNFVEDGIDNNKGMLDKASGFTIDYKDFERKLYPDRACTYTSLQGFTDHSSIFKVQAESTLDTVQVGDYVNVTCVNPIKLLTEDRWDTNATDNYLHIICRPDRKFDSPPTVQLPWCKAQCPAEKPTPPPDYNIVINPNKTSLTDKLWEDESLWYACTRETDGIAVWNNDTQAMEGSPVSEIEFKCNEKGKYSLEVDSAGQYIVPKCLRRPLRCQCLGDFMKREHSLRALDTYCRNESYSVVPGLSGNQIYPNKNRCGNLDPILMRQGQSCHCHTRDVLGADNAFWLKQEIYGIPWQDKLLQFDSQEFKNAKYLIEKAFDERFLEKDVEDRFFKKGYVRSLVMRLYKGPTQLNLFWNQTLADLRNGNYTNATSFDELETGILPGQAIEPAFDPTPEGVPRGLMTDPEVFTTMAHIEVQFKTPDAVEGGDPVYPMSAADFRSEFKDGFLQESLGDTNPNSPSDWPGKLWINSACHLLGQDQCGEIKEVDRCRNDGKIGFDKVTEFEMLHSNLGRNQDNEQIPIGSSANVWCESINKRIDQDRWDSVNNDFNLTIPCNLSALIVWPDVWPDINCLAWCPSEKPIPPIHTGLEISSQDNNTNEYWYNQTITYLCKDPTLGLDKSARNRIDYRCLELYPAGNYSIPESSDLWPVCETRTTTVKPAILSALDIVLEKYAMKITEKRTKEIYESNKFKGDPNYFISITLPSCALLVIFILICMCCTRYDNPYCKYCAKATQEEMNLNLIQ